MSKEAMKLALEALNNSVDLVVEDAYNAEKLYGNYPTRQGKVGGLKVLAENHKEAIKALEEALAKQEPVAEPHKGEPFVHGGRPMTLRECMEAEEPEQGHSFTYDQMKEHAEGMQRDYDLLLAEYNLLKQEQDEPVGYLEIDDIESQREYPHNCRNVNLWYEGGEGLSPVYTTPQPKQEQGEPVAAEREAIAVWLEKECDEQYLADRVRARGLK